VLIHPTVKEGTVAQRPLAVLALTTLLLAPLATPAEPVSVTGIVETSGFGQGGLAGVGCARLECEAQFQLAGDGVRLEGVHTLFVMTEIDPNDPGFIAFNTPINLDTRLLEPGRRTQLDFDVPTFGGFDPQGPGTVEVRFRLPFTMEGLIEGVDVTGMGDVRAIFRSATENITGEPGLRLIGLHYDVVPEPATLMLLGSGLAGLGGVSLWRSRRRPGVDSDRRHETDSRVARA
jgi:hypothetical protein